MATQNHLTSVADLESPPHTWTGGSSDEPGFTAHKGPVDPVELIQSWVEGMLSYLEKCNYKILKGHIGDISM